MTGLADLPTVVLDLLAGRPEADWHRAPSGKWTPAQIVHHLALSLEGSARAFEARRARGPMTRRPRTLGERLRHFLIMRLGWPPPAAKAPSAVWPAEHPDPRAIERQLRDGVDRFLSLEAELLPARARDLLVTHPALGDLTLPEWQRFHVWHSIHHAAQIRARLES